MGSLVFQFDLMMKAWNQQSMKNVTRKTYHASLEAAAAFGATKLAMKMYTEYRKK